VSFLYLKKVKEAGENMSVNAGAVYSELVLNGDKYFSTLDKADKEMKSFESKLKGYGDKMEKVGKEWTTKVSAPIAGIGVIATKLGLDFQAAMSEVGAISGATGDDLAILEKKARDMGATTKFSASDAADGLKYMAMAGWDTSAMLEGLDGVLALAAASGEDLGMVSDIVTDSMTAFGLQAKEAGHFADVLAKASSSSNTNVGLMGETFKYVAPLAGSLGYSIEDTALAVGLMANAGIKGSQSGTALRSMITRLVKPTKESAEAIAALGIEITNADGTMKPLVQVMEELRGSFNGLNPEQQAFYAAQIAGQEAMSGFLAIVNASDGDFNKLRDNINNATGSAKEMSDMMQNNLKGRWEEFKSGLEEAALQIYDLLLPSLEKWLAKGQAFIDWFQGLDEGTKKTILNIAGFTVALGPALLIGGKFANSIGSIVGLFTKFSGAATVATGATNALTTPMWALGGATKASALLFNPWVAGAAAVGVGAVALAKHLKEDAIPALEELDESISETTRNAVTSFLDMEKDAKVALNQLAWSGMAVTEEMKDSITANTNQMADEVIAKLEEQKTEGLKHLQEMLDKSTTMSEEEKEEAIRIATEKYDEEIKKAQEGKARIEEILTEAKESNRKITDDERIEIEKIIVDLKDNSIRLMSENQEEQEKILENLKNNATRMTAEMMADVIKNSKEQKEKTIAEAEKEYQERLKFAETLKKDGSRESLELANKVIEEAERQKNEAVMAAEEMHEKVLQEVRNQGGDIVNQLDLDNGKIKTKWDELKDWFNRNPIVRWIKTHVDEGGTLNGDQENRFREGVSRRYAQGTNFHPGGWAWVGEQGPELVELPRASKVYTNQDSMRMVKGSDGGITQNIHIHSLTPLSPSEIARKNLQVSRQLAMEWGV
jgi:TP901 family phage tail tape measure protein